MKDLKFKRKSRTTWSWGYVAFKHRNAGIVSAEPAASYKSPLIPAIGFGHEERLFLRIRACDTNDRPFCCHLFTRFGLAQNIDIVVFSNLKAKVKNLCAQAVRSEGTEQQVVLSDLREAVRERSDRARGMVAEQKRRAKQAGYDEVVSGASCAEFALLAPSRAPHVGQWTACICLNSVFLPGTLHSVPAYI
jgi:hypothetical protein